MKAQVPDIRAFTHRFSFVQFFTVIEGLTLIAEATSHEEHDGEHLLYFEDENFSFALHLGYDDELLYGWKSNWLYVCAFSDHESVEAKVVKAVCEVIENLLLPYQLNELNQLCKTIEAQLYGKRPGALRRFDSDLFQLFRMAFRPFQAQLTFAREIQMKLAWTPLWTKYWETNLLFRSSDWDGVELRSSTLLCEILRSAKPKLDQHPEWVFAFYTGLGQRAEDHLKFIRVYTHLQKWNKPTNLSMAAIHAMVAFWQGDEAAYLHHQSNTAYIEPFVDPFPHLVKPFVLASVTGEAQAALAEQRRFEYLSGYPMALNRLSFSDALNTLGKHREAITNLHHLQQESYLSRHTKLLMLRHLLALDRHEEGFRCLESQMYYRYSIADRPMLSRELAMRFKRELRILNQPRLFHRYEAEFKALIPGFSADLLLQCIEAFADEPYRPSKPREVFWEAMTAIEREDLYFN